MLTALRGRTFRTIDAAVLFLLAAISGTSVAYAFQAPAAGDLGYDIYDIVVNQGGQVNKFNNSSNFHNTLWLDTLVSTQRFPRQQQQ